MIHQPLRIAFLFLSVVSAFGGLRTVVADDYVWARSNWGVMPGGTATSKMTNGYGGYYVPRNAAGNNYEGQRFTNPNGFIVPSQTPASNPPVVAQSAQPVVTASTQPVANPTVQATQLQQPQQPYRMTRRARRLNR